MKMVKDFLKWFSNQKLIIKCLVVIYAIAIFVLVLLGIYILFPYLLLVACIIFFAFYKHKEYQEAENINEIVRMRNLEMILHDRYFFLAEILVVLLREFNKELGIRVTTTDSIIRKDKWCKQKDNIWFFRYRAQCINDSEFNLEELRHFIQERLFQQTFDIPIWLVIMQRTDKHIEILCTFIDCDYVAQYRTKYEKWRYEKIHKTTVPSTLDKDF